MPDVVVRKKLTCVEEIFHEGGPVAGKPLRRAATLAVIRNPSFSLRDSLSTLGRESLPSCNATRNATLSINPCVDCGGFRRTDSGKECNGIQCGEHGSGILVDHSQ